MSKKDNILKSKKEISQLFSKGEFLFSHYIKAVYLKTENSTDFKFGFGVPKKRVKKAVHRNKIKRRMRESFRLISKSSSFKFCTTHVFLSYNSNKIADFKTIKQDVEKILTRLEFIISENKV